jgi:hypothetical protein
MRSSLVVNEDIGIKTSHILEAIQLYDAKERGTFRMAMDTTEIGLLRAFAKQIAGEGDRCLNERETKELIQILNKSNAVPGKGTAKVLDKIRESEVGGKSFKAFAELAKLIYLDNQILLDEQFPLLYQHAASAQTLKSWVEEFKLRHMSVSQYFPIVLQFPCHHAAFFLLYDNLVLKMDPSALQQFIPKLLPNAKYARGLISILGKFKPTDRITSAELNSLLRQIEQLQKIETALPDNLKDNIVRFADQYILSKNVVCLIEYMQEYKITLTADRLEKMIKFANNANRAIGLMHYLEVNEDPSGIKLFRIDLPLEELFDLVLEFPDEVMKPNAEWLKEKCGRDVATPTVTAPARAPSLKKAQALMFHQPSTSAPTGSAGSAALTEKKELQHSGPH